MSKCYVTGMKAPTGGGCPKVGEGEAAKRRECASETECCGGMRMEEADETNVGEFCYDKTKMEIDGASAGMAATWFIKDFWMKGAQATIDASATEAAWATYSAEDAKKKRDEAMAAEMKAAEGKKAVFGCIEGAKNVAASAAALMVASYMMA